jgi:hypothetical protein
MSNGQQTKLDLNLAFTFEKEAFEVLIVFKIPKGCLYILRPLASMYKPFYKKQFLFFLGFELCGR